jgi:hypothetical protein
LPPLTSSREIASSNQNRLYAPVSASRRARASDSACRAAPALAHDAQRGRREQRRHEQEQQRSAAGRSEAHGEPSDERRADGRVEDVREHDAARQGDQPGGRQRGRDGEHDERAARRRDDRRCERVRRRGVPQAEGVHCRTRDGSPASRASMRSRGASASRASS